MTGTCLLSLQTFTLEFIPMVFFCLNVSLYSFHFTMMKKSRDLDRDIKQHKASVFPSGLLALITCPTYPSELQIHTSFSLCAFSPSVGAAQVNWRPERVFLTGIRLTNSGGDFLSSARTGKWDLVAHYYSCIVLIFCPNFGLCLFREYELKIKFLFSNFL